MHRYLSGYHQYPNDGEKIESVVCSIGTPGCTLDAVFDTMLSQTRFIAPTEETTPVADCKITNLDIPLIPAGDDPIRTVVDRSAYSITNYTRYDHALHSGQVIRKLVEREGHILIDTSGAGFGIMPFANNLMAPSLWKDVDTKLIQAVQENS